MKKLIYPPNLNEGDTIAIVTPSGNIEDCYIDEVTSLFQDWGLIVQEMPHTRSKCGRFAGTTSERLDDLQTCMDDPNIKMIFCSRGGYGAVHLLDKLKFTKLKKNPKWLVGYSDITALHLAFKNSGMASIHAPMAKHLSENKTDESTIYLKEILMSNHSPEYRIDPHALNIKGEIRGHLIGGNLAVFCGLLGTKYTKVQEDSILFIEDIGECAYKIDRMMWNLKLSGTLKKIKGLIVGQFTSCDEDPQMYTPIYESIRAMMLETSTPTVFNYPVGHVNNNFPLIHGGAISLKIEENLVLHKNY